MKLSIITINLNNRNGLQKTIDSVISQTFKDFEWIVIDGGSTDGSKELIEHNADHFAYWVSEPDKGIYNAMNKGIKVAKGEYLLFMNSGDCISNESTLANVFFKEQTADIIYGDCDIIGQRGVEHIKYPEELHFKQLIDGTICHQSCLIRRQLLLDDPYDESLKIVSDWKFLIKKALSGYSFKHIALPISTYEMSGISSIQQDLVAKERKKIIQKKIPSCIISDCQTIDTQQELLNRWQIREVLKYTNKKKLYHKIVTANIKMMHIIDSIFKFK